MGNEEGLGGSLASAQNNSIVSKVSDMIHQVNTITGGTDTDLTSAIITLREAAGGSLSYSPSTSNFVVSGIMSGINTFTLTNDYGLAPSAGGTLQNLTGVEHVILKTNGRSSFKDLLLYNLSGSDSTLKKVSLMSSTNGIQSFFHFLYKRSGLEEIDGAYNFDFSSSNNNNGVFDGCVNLREIRVTNNSIKIKTNLFGTTTIDNIRLSNASFISIANGLATSGVSSSNKQLTFEGLTSNTFTDIIGTVSDGVFTESARGNVTLRTFIVSSQYKGWTLLG